MPNNTSNAVIYATLKQQPLQGIVIANGTAANTITDIVDAASTATVVTDILFRSSSTSTIAFEIIICTTGSQASAAPNVQINVPAGSGNTGSVALCSLASLCPQLFAIDLSGNRVLGLEAGKSLYVMNTTIISVGQVTVTKKARDY